MEGGIDTSTQSASGAKRALKRVLPELVAVLLLATLIGSIWSFPNDRPRVTTPPRPAVEATPLSPCATDAPGPFSPTSITAVGIFENAAVVGERRHGQTPGVTAVSETGKREFAWDVAPPGTLPGSNAGTSFFVAHTWPWSLGGALGNDMLTNLHKGSVLIVQGADTKQCYRVTDQVEVPATSHIAPWQDTTGPAQIGILVCSGTRLGPGNWSHRTIWFATPFTGDV